MAPPSDTPPPLVVSAVTKTFDQGNSQVRALDGIDLNVRTGEFVAIMGASGSGKSTLLHAMAGLTDVNSGSIRVDGQDLAAFNDATLTRFRRERIGLVFQAFNLIPVLSAEDNVRLPAADQPGLEAKIDAVLRRLGIEARRKHRPDALSGGEQQRVAIARALITDPAILLADEPTGSLDSVTGQDLCRLLHELSKNDCRTLCVVTHEPTVAMWADRVVVLKDGRVSAEFATSGSHDPEAISEGYRKALQS